MPLADFLGWNSQDWQDTIGLVGVFFVAFPLLVHALVGLIAAQVLGEKRENEQYANGEELDPSRG
jgi:hypothetical protein